MGKGLTGIISDNYNKLTRAAKPVVQGAGKVAGIAARDWKGQVNGSALKKAKDNKQASDANKLHAGKVKTVKPVYDTSGNKVGSATSWR